MTPEMFAKQQQQKKRESGPGRKQLAQSVNLRPVQTEFEELRKRESKENASATLKRPKPKFVDKFEARKEVFQGGKASKRQEEGAKNEPKDVQEGIKAAIRTSVKGRYLKEIKDVSDTMKEHFWRSYTRKSGDHFEGLAVQGWRDYMEDTMDFSATTQNGLEQLFGVYDGHGGDDCSKYLENFLLKRIAMHGDLKSDPKAAMLDSFVRINESFLKTSAKTESGDSGSTATVLYVSKADKANGGLSYTLSYVGDSRAILVYKDGSALPLSTDHHLTREDELERITAGNGEVRYDPEFNESLVYNTEIDRGLAVTRSIGDADFKPLVTATPEISEGYITEDCLYICLASDGLWAKVSNNKAGEILVTHGCKEGVDILANLANARSTFDNITIVALDCNEMREKMK